MCLTENKKRHLKLTDSVLMAPAWDSSITKKAYREINKKPSWCWDSQPSPGIFGNFF